MNSSSIKVGKIYRHYSGKTYKVLSLANYSEDPKVVMVIYQGIYTCPTFGKNPVWCRPLSMFTEIVEINGKLQPRFEELVGQLSEEIFHHGIKFIVKNNLGQILILLQNGRDWDLPGGRVQINEGYEDAGKREVQEEIGACKLSNIKYISTLIPPNTRFQLNQHQSFGIVYSFYSADINDQNIVLSDEHSDYKWIDLKDAMKYLGNYFGNKFQEIVNKLNN